MKEHNNFDDNKLDAPEVEIRLGGSDNRFLKWIENFWYYHKWKVLIGLFFAVVLGVGIGQMVNKEEQDAVVVVAAPTYFYAEHVEGLDQTLTALLPSDGEDGAKSLTILTYPIYSEEELKAANEAETDDEGRFIIQVSQPYNTSKIEEYGDYLKTGECSILFISEYLYSNLLAQDRLRPMAEVFGEKLPAGVRPDGYGIRLGDTELYRFFDEMKVLPEDTVICLMRSYIWGASSDAEKYAETEEYFKRIVTFGNDQ